jgi:hypothetical protein
MKTEQRCWTKDHGWSSEVGEDFKNNAQIVFAFGSSSSFKNEILFKNIKDDYPHAHLVGCSTAGEIYDTRVLDDSLVLTAAIFDSTTIKAAYSEIGNPEFSHQAGTQLAQSLEKENLIHVLVFSDGLKVNGSELVNGLIQNLPKKIGVTGGLAGDGDRFKETLVCSNNSPKKDHITALGFYGSSLKVSYGSMGGFSPFGPERLVTRAKGNVLYELDGQSALDLYKKFLGEERSRDLATNQFYFPLSYRRKDQKIGVVRTILAINEKENSMTFAGDISEGGYARLMKSNSERLIDGAIDAANTCSEFSGSENPDLALLISCVGRKIILNQRVEEEIESVRDTFNQDTTLMGFYSYGEIAHFTPDEPCQLHNQTMTITTFREA